MLDITATGKVTAFLDKFGAALAAGDIEAVTAMFEDDCYWRDLVTFTWNIKTMEGKTEIADMLRHQLASCKPSNWQVAEGLHARGHDITLVAKQGSQFSGKLVALNVNGYEGEPKLASAAYQMHKQHELPVHLQNENTECPFGPSATSAGVPSF